MCVYFPSLKFQESKLGSLPGLRLDLQVNMLPNRQRVQQDGSLFKFFAYFIDLCDICRWVCEVLIDVFL